MATETAALTDQYAQIADQVISQVSALHLNHQALVAVQEAAVVVAQVVAAAVAAGR